MNYEILWVRIGNLNQVPQSKNDIWFPSRSVGLSISIFSTPDIYILYLALNRVETINLAGEFGSFNIVYTNPIATVAGLDFQ